MFDGAIQRGARLPNDAWNIYCKDGGRLICLADVNDDLDEDEMTRPLLHLGFWRHEWHEHYDWYSDIQVLHSSRCRKSFSNFGQNFNTDHYSNIMHSEARP